MVGCVVAYQCVPSGNSAAAMLLLEHVEAVPDDRLLAFAEQLVASLPLLLQRDVPRRLLDKTRDVWLRLHALMPMRLRKLHSTCVKYFWCNILQTIRL